MRHVSRTIRPTFWSLVRSKSLLAHSYRRGSHFDQFVFADKLEGLLERQLAKGHEAHCVVCRRRSHIGKLFLSHHVYVQIDITSVLSDHHPFVNFGPWS